MVHVAGIRKKKGMFRCFGDVAKAQKGECKNIPINKKKVESRRSGGRPNLTDQLSSVSETDTF